MKNIKNNAVSSPSWYNWHPEIECKDVCKHFNWCRGNSIKYLWRAGKKNKDKEIEDLKKAAFFINEEIEEIEGLKLAKSPQNTI